MTDLETLKQILTRAGVVFVEQESNDEGVPGMDVIIKEGQGPNNLGYMSFVTILSFSQDGSLKTVGAWE